MSLATIFRFIIIILTGLCGLAVSTPSAAQVKLVLDFDDSNYVLRKDAVNGRENPEYWSPAFFEKSRLDLAYRPDPSPSGGRYLRLNGISDFIKLPANTATQIKGEVAYSVSCWLYLPAEHTDGDIINANDQFLSGYRFFIEDNTPKIEMIEGTSEVFSSGFRMEARRWYHVGFFCDGVGDTLLMYINGSIVTASDFTKVTQVNTGPSACIGARLSSPNPNFLRANMDDVRFFLGKDTIFESVSQMTGLIPDRIRKRRPELVDYVLAQNYPNPFNLATTVSFELRKNGYITLQVFDILGNMVKTIFEGELGPGTHDYVWEAEDKNGGPMSSGIYFLRMNFEGTIQTKKMILVK